MHRIPIFWLFIGPPAIRFLGERSAMASMHGDFDLWNIFRVLWWCLWGGVALHALYQRRRQVRALLRNIGWLRLWLPLWFVALYLSCLVSPAPLFSLANVSMLMILVVAAFDLSVRVYVGNVSLRQIVKGFLVFSAGLLALVALLLLIDLNLVGEMTSAGPRVRGGEVAYTPLLSVLVFFAALYFWLNTPSLTGRMGGWPLVMTLALALLLLGQTRSAYGGLVIGLGLFVWQWSQLRRNMVHLMTATALVVATTCAFILLADTSKSASNVLRVTGDELIRDRRSISTLTGRTRVFRLLWQEVKDEPLGLGFSAGPRAVLQDPANLDVIYVNSFGNAHNAFVEVFAGSGYVGLLAWMGIVICVLLRLFRLRPRELVPLHAMLVTALIGGMTESNLVIPFEQESVTFWIVAAVMVAVGARRRQEKEQRFVRHRMPSAISHASSSIPLY